MTQLKLIGAENFTCRAAGIQGAKAGEIVTVDEAYVEMLLELTYKAGIGNDKSLFSKSLKAPVATGGMRPVPVGERRDAERAEREREAEAAAQRQETEDALARADAAEARIAALEAKLGLGSAEPEASGEEEVTDEEAAPVPEAKPRKRTKPATP